MANEIITTLHPDQDPDTNLYPNIKKENIPNKSIDMNKVGDDVKSLLDSVNELHPSGVDTSTNILAFTTNKGIYVGSDTGHWYYWNGTHYADGGVYQSTIIQDESVNILKTNFYVRNELNLLNKDTITRGHYIFTNGEIMDNSNYFYTDYIPYIPEFVYFILAQSTTFIAFYDENYGFISGTTTINSSFINKTATIKYIRLSMPLINLDKCYLSKIESIKNPYEIDNKFINNDVSNINITKGKYNLFDSGKYTLNWFKYYVDGTVRNAQNYYYSDFIEITPNTPIYFKRGGDQLHLTWYDSDYNFISGNLISSSGVNTNFTSPVNARYLIVSGHINYINTIMVSYDDLPYIPYYLIDSLDKFYTNETRGKVYIKPNGDFDDIVDGFNYAFNRGNCDVYIDGEWELNDYLTKITDYQGIRIGKNNKYYFTSKSKITFTYTGDDTNIQTYVSAFISRRGFGDFEMYNANIECYNVEYCVHDENGGITDNTTYSYTHKYIDCQMKITRNFETNIKHCIGGGIGEDGYVVLDGCIFNAVDSVTGDVGWHGNYANNQYSQLGKFNLFITNCYFEHTLQLRAPDPETSPKKLLFTNNSMSLDIIYTNTDNTKWDVKKWHNEIRS